MANSIIDRRAGRPRRARRVIAELVARDGHRNLHAHAGPFFGIADSPRYAAVVGQDKHLRPFDQAGG